MTLGGVLVGSNISHAEAREEIAKSLPIHEDVYDLIINGAGLSGFFVALEARKRGLKTLVVDKRPFAGYDIAAKRKLWLNADGFERWDKELQELFLPDGEIAEIENELLENPKKSFWKNELLLFPGSLKKGMLRTLLVNKIDVFLTTDVCGIVADKNKRTAGVVVASKHGLFSIRTRHFFDTTDQNFFSKDLFKQQYKITEAGFVLELEQVEQINETKLIVDKQFGVTRNQIYLHKGKKFSDQYFLEFNFPVDNNDQSLIEQKARAIALHLSGNFAGIHAALAKATVRFNAYECSFKTETKEKLQSSLKQYDYVETLTEEYSCQSILQLIETARKKVAGIRLPNEVAEGTKVYYIGGIASFKKTPSTSNEVGFATPLSNFDASHLTVESRVTSALVAGAGTAGSLVAQGTAENGVKTTILEYFNDLGGTKTVAGVNSYYFGHTKHSFIRNLERKVGTFSRKHNLGGVVSRGNVYLESLMKLGCEVVTGAIICGAESDNNQLKNVIICVNGKLIRYQPEITIDATGDASVAFFAGEKFEIGDARMGVTQNYSHWDLAFRSKIKDYNRDYDIIDSTEVLEYQRGLFLAHYEAHYYDFYPMQAIRESRRPDTLYRLNVNDLLDGVSFDDNFAQARSDYDPHYFGSSEYTRCAFMLPHYDNKELVNIPYRAIVPKNIDGLLLSGKAIGLTHNALQFTRMSADVTVLGYVTGCIAADLVKKGIRARDYSIAAIQKEFIAKSYLPDQLPAKNESLTDLVDQLTKTISSGDNVLMAPVLSYHSDSIQVDAVSSATARSFVMKRDAELLFSCCRKKKSEILPLLLDKFKESKSLLVAKALCWFGHHEGVDMLIEELEKKYDEEVAIGHPATYFEVYDPSILYWQINQLIGLLAMAGDMRSHELISRILRKSQSGGKRVAANDAYNAGRIDLQLVPYYNRILNLCFYIEKNPDERFVPGLEKLLGDTNLKNYKSTSYSEPRWRVYGANLELFVASSLARCGGKYGMLLLADYMNDIHSVFRKFVHAELVELTGKDYKYDGVAWSRFIQSSRAIIKCTPLVKEVEV
jgi:hypothetical protein